MLFFCWVFLYILVRQGAPASSYLFLVPVVESGISPRTISFLLLKVRETRIACCSVFTTMRVPLFLGPLSWQSKWLCVCATTSVCTHILKWFYMEPCASLVSCTWVHTSVLSSNPSPVEHSSLLSSSLVNSHSNSENPGCQLHHPLTYCPCLVLSSASIGHPHFLAYTSLGDNNQRVQFCVLAF